LSLKPPQGEHLGCAEEREDWGKQNKGIGSISVAILAVPFSFTSYGGGR